MQITKTANIIKLLITAFWCLIIINYAASQNIKPKSIPEDMVLVTAGKFIMGNNNDYHDNDFDETPQHIVDLPPFYIDKYPVTNVQYKKFVDASSHQAPRFWDESGNYPADKAAHPVVGVTFSDAQAYAQWAGKRLPTEEEWEKAARGTDGQRFPWGNVFDHKKANVTRRGTTPVGSYPDGVSPYGAYDMSGNVWEFCDTWYEVYPNSPENKTVERLTGKKHKVARGGSYHSDIGSARCADRGINLSPTGTGLGFRCAMDVPGYEHYRDAVDLLDQAKELKTQAELFITAYEEHTASRALLAKAEDMLTPAVTKFKSNDFEASTQLSQQAIEIIQEAYQLALDYTKEKHNKKIALTKAAFAELEGLIEKIPAKLKPEEIALKNKVVDYYKKGQIFFDEKSWGYAQMYAYIGLALSKRLLGIEEQRHK